MARRLFRKAVEQGRSERRGESYSLPYVEPLSDARTPLASFVNSLLDTVSDPIPSRKVQASAVTTISLRLG